MITWNVAAATPPPSVMRAVLTHLVDTYSYSTNSYSTTSYTASISDLRSSFLGVTWNNRGYSSTTATSFDHDPLSVFLDAARSKNLTDPQFMPVFNASFEGKEAFVTAFRSLGILEQFHLLLNMDSMDSYEEMERYDVHRWHSLGLVRTFSSPNHHIKEMMRSVALTEDLGREFFEVCAWAHTIYPRMLANPHFPTDLLIGTIPWSMTLEDAKLDDEALLKLHGRWGDVSASLDSPQNRWASRGAEALFNLATRMRVALRAGDWSGAVGVALEASDAAVYGQALRLSSPRMNMLEGPSISAYEAHFLMRAGVPPSMVRCLEPAVLEDVVGPIRSPLISVIDQMASSGCHGIRELDDLSIRYARESATVFGGFDGGKGASTHDRVEWLSSCEPSFIAFVCASRDPRVSPVELSLSTALCHLRGTWEDRATIIRSHSMHDGELRDKMMDPTLVQRQIDRFGGLSAPDVGEIDLMEEHLEALPDEVCFFHGTSEARYEDGLPEKGVPPIKEAGLLSPKDMRNEDYEVRNDRLDVVFLSPDPCYAFTYAKRTVSQDANRGVTTKPILLVCTLGRDEVISMFRFSDRKYPSLADALVKLRLPASLDGKIPSEVTRRGVPAAIIRSVIDLSGVDHEKDVLRMLPDGVRPLKELASSRVIG